MTITIRHFNTFFSDQVKQFHLRSIVWEQLAKHTTTDVVNMGNYSQHDAQFNLAQDQSQLKVVRMR